MTTSPRAITEVPTLPLFALRDTVYAGNKRAPIHRWVKWIAGFSAEFAGHAIDQYVVGSRRQAEALVLDPFAGVGTTLVEAQRRGVPSVGFEINPFAVLVSRAKLGAAKVDPGALRCEIERYALALGEVEAALDAREEWLAPRRQRPPGFHTRVPFYSPAVERKVLHSLDYIDDLGDTIIADLFRLAFASTMVSYSNYTYEPSLGSRRGAQKPNIEQAPVADRIAAKLRDMADDVTDYTRELARLPEVPAADVRHVNFFKGSDSLSAGSVDLLVTSPPYLNNYHYVRNTRPQMYWLNFISTPGDQTWLETENFGKFWQTVRDEAPVELDFDMPRLGNTIAELRQVTSEKKGAYGGKGWANYAATYYNDSHRLVERLKRLLRPGGTAIIVVGNNVLQGVEFKVDEDLVEIGRLLNLEGRTELVRKTRVGSSIMGTGLRHRPTRQIELYEAAVVLRRPGKS